MFEPSKLVKASKRLFQCPQSAEMSVCAPNPEAFSDVLTGVNFVRVCERHGTMLEGVKIACKSEYDKQINDLLVESK